MKAIIEEVFKCLDGCTCRVKSGGLLVQGSIEGDVKLSYSEHTGLIITAPLKWNDVKPQNEVLPILNNHLPLTQKEEFKHLEPITFNARDQIHDELKTVIENLWVNVGAIYKYGIKDISFSTREKSEELYSVEIVYEKSTVSIFAIQAPK